MYSFFTKEKATITTMLKNSELEPLINEIEEGFEQGTHAFGFSFSGIKAENKNHEFFETLFKTMKGRPIYLCNYRRTSSDKALTDDMLSAQLLEYLEIALKYSEEVLIDVPANLYDPSDYELSSEEQYIVRQIEFADKIHQKGGKVLMSSHMFRFLKGDDVLKISIEHAKRGADISKIVTDANNEIELGENIKTSILLKDEAPVPYLFLCNGTHCRKHRLLSPILGSTMALTVVNSSEKQNQPKLDFANTLEKIITEHEM